MLTFWELVQVTSSWSGDHNYSWAYISKWFLFLLGEADQSLRVSNLFWGVNPWGFEFYSVGKTRSAYCLPVFFFYVSHIYTSLLRKSHILFWQRERIRFLITQIIKYCPIILRKNIIWGLPLGLVNKLIIFWSSPCLMAWWTTVFFYGCFSPLQNLHKTFDCAQTSMMSPSYYGSLLQ